MNKIQRIQKLFHTDKWWGKALFIILFYALFGFLFYGVWLITVSSFSDYEYDIYNTILFFGLFFLHILLPLATFFIFPKIIKKFLRIKYTYLINSIAMFLILVIFLFFEILISIKDFFSQGFF